MILNSQLLSKFVLVRENSRLVNSQRPGTPKLPIPPILPHIGLFSGILLPDALLLCVLCELCGCNSIMQNKANVKMGKMTISTATIKAYANKQRTMNHERHSKQTQSNPIPSRPTSVQRLSSLVRRPSSLLPPPRRARYDRRGVERLSGV